MKYLKRFENRKLKYEVGDYVLFRNEYIEFWSSSNDKKIVFKYSKIVEKHETQHNFTEYVLDVICDNKINPYYVSDYAFERKLKKSEIAEYEFKISQLKYNL